jgi:hypothetical protein
VCPPKTSVANVWSYLSVKRVERAYLEIYRGKFAGDNGQTPENSVAYATCVRMIFDHTEPHSEGSRK